MPFTVAEDSIAGKAGVKRHDWFIHAQAIPPSEVQQVCLVSEDEFREKVPIWVLRPNGSSGQQTKRQKKADQQEDGDRDAVDGSHLSLVYIMMT